MLQKNFGITGEEVLLEPSEREQEHNYREHAPFAYVDKPTLPLTGFGEDKKGMVSICSVCGTPLKDGKCPTCEK
jgi:rubrerythrin